MWTNVYTTSQLGSFIRECRKGKHMTQARLAELAGTSHATLSALENGKAVSTATAAQVLQELGLRLIVVPKDARADITEAGRP